MIDCSWDFRGKSCVVTGAANGIGRAVSELLAAAGAELMLVDRDEKNLASTVISCSKSSSSNPLSIVADVSKKNDIE